MTDEILGADVTDKYDQIVEEPTRELGSEDLSLIDPNGGTTRPEQEVITEAPSSPEQELKLELEAAAAKSMAISEKSAYDSRAQEYLARVTAEVTDQQEKNWYGKLLDKYQEKREAVSDRLVALIDREFHTSHSKDEVTSPFDQLEQELTEQAKYYDQENENEALNLLAQLKSEYEKSKDQTWLEKLNAQRIERKAEAKRKWENEKVFIMERKLNKNFFNRPDAHTLISEAELTEVAKAYINGGEVLAFGYGDSLVEDDSIYTVSLVEGSNFHKALTATAENIKRQQKLGVGSEYKPQDTLTKLQEEIRWKDKRDTADKVYEQVSVGEKYDAQGQLDSMVGGFKANIEDTERTNELTGMYIENLIDMGFTRAEAVKFAEKARVQAEEYRAQELKEAEAERTAKKNVDVSHADIYIKSGYEELSDIADETEKNERLKSFLDYSVEQLMQEGMSEEEAKAHINRVLGITHFVEETDDQTETQPVEKAATQVGENVLESPVTNQDAELDEDVLNPEEEGLTEFMDTLEAEFARIYALDNLTDRVNGMKEWALYAENALVKKGMSREKAKRIVLLAMDNISK